MLNPVLANDSNIAGFLSQRAGDEKSALVEEKNQPPTLPTASGWFLFTGTLRNVREYLEYAFGATKTTNVTGPIDEALNWLVEKGVRIENPVNVRSYLFRYSDLLPVIPPVWEKAASLLLPSTQFTLALYRDPEISDEYLTLYARQQEYQRNILDVTHAVNVECEALLSGRSGWLLTTTDFRSPK